MWLRRRSNAQRRSTPIAGVAEGIAAGRLQMVASRAKSPGWIATIKASNAWRRHDNAPSFFATTAHKPGVGSRWHGRNAAPGHHHRNHRMGFGWRSPLNFIVIPFPCPSFQRFFGDTDELFESGHWEAVVGGLCASRKLLTRPRRALCILSCIKGSRNSLRKRRSAAVSRR